MLSWDIQQSDRIFPAPIFAASISAGGQACGRSRYARRAARIRAGVQPAPCGAASAIASSLFPKLSSWFGSRRDALYIGEINEILRRRAT